MQITPSPDGRQIPLQCYLTSIQPATSSLLSPNWETVDHKSQVRWSIHSHSSITDIKCHPHSINKLFSNLPKCSNIYSYGVILKIQQIFGKWALIASRPTYRIDSSLYDWSIKVHGIYQLKHTVLINELCAILKCCIYNIQFSIAAEYEIQ